MTTAGPHGASAYFSPPEQTLDPSLFTPDGHLNPDVRDHILGALYGFFKREGIQVGSWLHAWLAGSGISYQWRASRGNSDLDVLIGIDPQGFVALNPEFAAASRGQLADTINEQMRHYLWPVTADTRFGASVYEVTYYWNAEVSNDITVVRPYAAWNLDTSRWDVPPDPAPPVEAFPPAWDAEARGVAARVHMLYTQWSQNLHDVLLLSTSNPAHASAAIRLQSVTAELRSLWALLHEGRRSAFTRDGGGWADWHNYLWQASKANGTVSLLSEVVREAASRQAAMETRLYGTPIQPADVALRRAAALYTRWA